jgi:hypothetical protein
VPRGKTVPSGKLCASRNPLVWKSPDNIKELRDWRLSSWESMAGRSQIRGQLEPPSETLSQISNQVNCLPTPPKKEQNKQTWESMGGKEWGTRVVWHEASQVIHNILGPVLDRHPLCSLQLAHKGTMMIHNWPMRDTEASKILRETGKWYLFSFMILMEDSIPILHFITCP